MTGMDLTPMLRSTIGFDRMLDLLDRVASLPDEGWPPYNIIKRDDDHYGLQMAVAGFDESMLDVSVQENILIVRGRRAEDGNGQYLHRGIAGRGFERRFNLADFLKVERANLRNGLLEIELVREIPEELKPRTIEIETGQIETGSKTNPPMIEGKPEHQRAA